MKKIYELTYGFILLILIVITGNDFTGSVVRSSENMRYSFTWINILFFFLIMAFILWLVKYVKSGGKHKNKKNSR